MSRKAIRIVLFVILGFLWAILCGINNVTWLHSFSELALGVVGYMMIGYICRIHHLFDND